MNKIPCASQNTEAKTLPADVCVFGRFRWLSPAAVHSANCRFDSGGKWWIHVSSIVTYLCKNTFLLHWNSCKQRSESLTCCFWLTVSKCGTHFQHCFLIVQSECCICSQFSHWQMFMQNDEYTAFWYLQLLCYLTQLQFMISQNNFVKFFGVFWDNCRIWVTWAFSIICVCITIFKVSIPPLNCCFRWSRVWIAITKPLICWNRIFPHQEAMLYQHMKFRFFHCFKICNCSFT